MVCVMSFCSCRGVCENSIHCEFESHASPRRGQTERACKLVMVPIGRDVREICFDPGKTMPTDWQARLTPMGYHALPAKRQDTAARWDCTPEEASDGWFSGDAIVAFDPENKDTTLCPGRESTSQGLVRTDQVACGH